jgi:hypothetical protein
MTVLRRSGRWLLFGRASPAHTEPTTLRADVTAAVESGPAATTDVLRGVGVGAYPPQ